MSARELRFRPPAVEAGPILRWLLARAYGAPGAPLPEVPGSEAVELARRLALAARIAARTPRPLLIAELGSEAAAALQQERAAIAAQELRLAEAFAAFAAVAADRRVPFAPLKGLALKLGGYALAAARPSSDLDLLIPETAIDRLHAELLGRGFEVAGEAYEHQLPALRHATGGLVELHRTIPGLRLDTRRDRKSATFEEVAGAGGFSSRPIGADARPEGDLRQPSREILTAHALVHAIAQHGFAPASYSGFVLIADLQDLGFRDGAGVATLGVISPWIGREVGFEEAKAALDLTSALTAGDGSLFDAPRSPARILLDHFHAGITDPGYARSLKKRILERPLSDLPRGAARARLAARTILPSRRVAGRSAPEGRLAYAARVAMRPLELLRRWFST